MILAAEENRRAFVNLLIRKNANLEAKTNSGLTALIIAAQNNNKDIVELLIRKRANAEIKDNQLTTLRIIEKIKKLTLRNRKFLFLYSVRLIY